MSSNGASARLRFSTWSLLAVLTLVVLARISSHLDDLTAAPPEDESAERALHKAWERGRAGIPLTFDEFEMLRRHDLLP